MLSCTLHMAAAVARMCPNRAHVREEDFESMQTHAYHQHRPTAEGIEQMHADCAPRRNQLHGSQHWRATPSDDVLMSEPSKKFLEIACAHIIRLPMTNSTASPSLIEKSWLPSTATGLYHHLRMESMRSHCCRYTATCTSNEHANGTMHHQEASQICREQFDK